MTRANDLHMHDPQDKEIHSKEGVDPYPVPREAEKVGRAEGDLEDPAKDDADAPHDRGKARAGEYTTGTDAMKKKLKSEGEIEDWQAGRTQGAPPRKH